MVNFFKNFGKGILYVLVLPFLLIILALYFGVSIIIFIYLGFKGIILFLTGRNLFGDFPEDIEAKRILNGEPTMLNELEETKPSNEDISTTSNSGINLYPNGYTTNIYNAVFNNEEEKPLTTDESSNENSNEEEIHTLEENKKPVNNDIEEIKDTEPEEEIIGRYIPFSEKKKRESTSTHNDDDDNQDSGVYISNYDGGDD